jgi:deoxyribose-phosphate aldolase
MSNTEQQISSCKLAKCIDHTLLEPVATEEQIERLCDEAKEHGFCSVFVHTKWITHAADRLYNSGVKVGSVVSFPHGADSTRIKAAQAKDAVFYGADEIDMVADLSAIIERNSKYLFSQLQAVLRVCRSMKPEVVLKVIIEAPALNLEQKLFACSVCEKAGVDFIKTSTGFHPAGGATIEDVRLIKDAAAKCKVKAAGGIRTAKQAIEFIKAGADRIGTSSAVRIMEEFKVGNY